MIAIKRIVDLFTPAAFKIYPSEDSNIGIPLMDVQKAPTLTSVVIRPTLTSPVIRERRYVRKKPGFFKRPPYIPAYDTFGGRIPDIRRVDFPQNPANVPMDESDPVLFDPDILDKPLPKLFKEPPAYTKDPSYKPSPQKPNDLEDFLDEVRPEAVSVTPKATAKNLVGYGLIGTIAWSLLA